MEHNSFEKFEAMALLLILASYFRFFLKKDFLQNPVNLDMESSSNYFSCSSRTFKVKLQVDIRAIFLQVLTYYGFSRLLCYDDARQN